MDNGAIDFNALRAPFPASDIEWRIGRAGEKNGKVWATCLAYLTARAIMDRLDDVAGPANWRNEYREAPAGGVLCGISIRVGEEWVTKWDGAENTDIEGVKGGLSGAMKRAAVHWGIGRYLYHLDEGFANVHPNGANYAKIKGGGSYKWDPPQLPDWALPKGDGQKPPAPAANRSTGEIDEPPQGAATPNAPAGDVPPCPACNGPMWDNRTDPKAGVNGGKRPDLKCKDKDCDTAIWLDGLATEVKGLAEQAALAGVIEPDEAGQIMRVAVEPKHPAKLLRAKAALEEKMLHAQGVE
jgi:hypothetical protein